MIRLALNYLFEDVVIGSKKPIALTVNRWSCTPTNCVHLPMRIIIIYHMKIPMPTSANSPYYIT